MKTNPCRLLATVALIVSCRLASADDVKDVMPCPQDDRIMSGVDGVGCALDDNPWSACFVAGAGFYLVEPHFNTNPGFSVSRTQLGQVTSSSGNSISASHTDFDYDLDFAPQVWLGFVTDRGLGVRARWWRFDHSANMSILNGDTTGIVTIASETPLGIGLPAASSLFGPGGESDIPAGISGTGLNAGHFAFSTDLRLDVWDAEATQNLHSGPWCFLFSGGARYAHLSQDYQAFQSGTTGQQVHVNTSQLILSSATLTGNTATLLSGHNFDGVGPTVATEVRRSLGRSGLSLYADARVSVLFGSSKQRVDLAAIQTVESPVVSTVELRASSEANTASDKVLPVGELDVGVEWSSQLGPVHPLIQAALSGQSWFGAGSATSQSGNLGFLGLSLIAGARY
jgi:hypothetical protein